VYPWLLGPLFVTLLRGSLEACLGFSVASVVVWRPVGCDACCVCAGVNQETFVREVCTPRRILPRLVTVCSTVFETCWVLVLAQLFDWRHREVL